MDKRLILSLPEFDGLMLRSIVLADQENLRQWKNANRFAFFYQEIISAEDQLKWFDGYLERAQDWMFVVCVERQSFGCMGFRLIGREADVYNVILGNRSMGKRGLMRNALRLMCSYIAVHFTREIAVKVLRSKRAVDWYCKSGFVEQSSPDDFLRLELDWTQFQPCAFEVSS